MGKYVPYTNPVSSTHFKADKPISMTTPHQPQPHTDGIPEDIMESARDAARRMTLEVDDDGRPYIPADDIEEIAKSILDERNRHKDGWQPIETAPKDGRQRVLLWDGKRVYEGGWGLGRYNRSTREYEAAWISSPNSGDTKPSHWQPLPKPPFTTQSQMETDNV